ncbi:MAG: MFS transporter [Lentisphaeria bacterium]|nr:MFS transporter [Lentisphaeria bacterium]
MKFTLFREPVLTPDQVNAENQVTDKKILSRDRLKFGVGCIMYQNEESALMPIHTLLVKLLGGTEIHLGIIGAASSVGSFVQWIGSLLLRWTGSNKRAMNIALSGGIVFGLFMAISLAMAGFRSAWMPLALIIYLIGAVCLAGASGVQNNIECSWIGDLVPKNHLGWFTSAKWMIGSLGALLFLWLFGQIAKQYPTPLAFAWVLLFIAFSHLLAIILMSTVTDRKPQTLNLISTSGEQLNYASMPLWCYIWFYVAWAGGRAALAAFTAAYLLDSGYKMDVIAMLWMIQPVINLIMLALLGKISDRSGARLPLLLISGTLGACMLLWSASAWFGLTAIVIYQILNGMAGNTHSMLAINYGLEIFPAKGRASYIAFARILIGITAIVAALAAGVIMHATRSIHFTLAGAQLNNYHIFFAGCSLVTISCILPLLLAGNRKVMPRNQQ